MAQYHYIYCALIIYICTLYLFYVKKHIKDDQSRFYEITLWAGLTCCLFDIISEEAINHTDKYPIWLIYLSLYIYFIMQNSIPFLTSLYELTLIGKRKKLEVKEKIILYTPVCLTVILLLTNNWTKLVFYVDDNGIYRHGIGFIFLFFQSVYYLILNIAYNIHYKKLFEKRIRYMFIALSIAMVPIILLDLYLDIMIQSLCIALCYFLIFIAIQNTEDVLVDSSGLLTNYALIKQSQLDLTNKYPFTILLIKLENKTIINYTFGFNCWIALLDEVSQYLKSLGSEKRVYNLEDGLYAIMMRYDYTSDEKERLMKSIASKFESSKWDVLNTELSISVQMLELSSPGDIKEINDISYYIKYYSENMINSERVFLTVSDLNVKLKEQRTEKTKRLWDIIESSQYEICFMPVYSVSQNRIISREPLIKLNMNPPVYVSPYELDNETTDYRQLNRIHKRIFEDICIYLENHPSDEDSIEYMNVSLPVTQMMQEDFIEQCYLFLEKHRVDFGRIGIELSTVMAFYNQPVIMRNILELNKHGATFILDQYGTGYSNIEHFKQIKFKFVKLDKSIVKACLGNDKGLSVLNSIIAMMRQLKATVIADGVDSKELADLLISIGIDNLEGPYYLDDRILSA